MSEGQHFDQGVPNSVVRRIQDIHLHPEAVPEKISKKQQNRNRKNIEKRQKLKDLAGFCHIQASISLTDQTLDRNCGGGHFLCYPHSHSDVHWKLVGGTYRATPSEKEREDDEADIKKEQEEHAQLERQRVEERRKEEEKRKREEEIIERLKFKRFMEMQEEMERQQLEHEASKR
jgi:hypothetical protein